MRRRGRRGGGPAEPGPRESRVCGRFGAQRLRAIIIGLTPAYREEGGLSQPALVEPLRRWDPEQIGGYVLAGRLGAGAMGQVYLGLSASGRLVAVKTIQGELAEGRGSRPPL